MSVKYWWSDDFKWFCLLVDDGVNKATVSLTPEQAQPLSARVPKCVPTSTIGELQCERLPATSSTRRTTSSRSK